MLYVYLKQSIGAYLSGPAGNSREHCIVKSLLPVCRCYSLSPPPLPSSPITPPAVLIIWSWVPLAGNTTSVPFPHDTASCAILTAVRYRMCSLFQGKGRTRETRSLDTILYNLFLDAACPEAYSFLSAHQLSDVSRAMIKVQTQFMCEITECDAYITMYSRGQQSTRVSPMWLIQLNSTIKDAPPWQTECFIMRSHAFRKKPSVFSWLDMQNCNLTQIL